MPSTHHPQPPSRQEYLRERPFARAWAALDRALNDAIGDLAYKPCMPKHNVFNKKKILVIGSGVGGLTTAYELLSRNDDISVTVLEARDRTGGRCLTLRTGDTLTEDKTSDLKSTPGKTQVCRFDRPVGDEEPYLNAGPGRIPSSHKHLLGYLRHFGVPVEVYVMNSDSNMSQMTDGPLGEDPVVNRRLDHNIRGWMSELVYKNASTLLPKAEKERIEELKSLMVTFGDLDQEGNYEVGVSPDGQDDNPHKSDRAGFQELPGVLPGKITEAIPLDTLLKSKFWWKTRLYQPADFLWQPTMFQPVGGMDRVEHAFAQQVASNGGILHLNSPVTSIDYVDKSFVVKADGHAEPFEADYVFCNMAMPFLEDILSDKLKDSSGKTGFSKDFNAALSAVYKAQAHEDPTDRFLAATTKVGWQANRDLWEGKPITTGCVEDGDEVLAVEQSQVGIVPIFGGISWTNHPITQIWYPSNGYHDKRGVLTGTYNFSDNAVEAGKMDVKDRLELARKGARLFGEEFSAGLQNGIAIAWQNMAHIKGGWAQWHAVGDTTEESVKHFNEIIQGTGVGGSSVPCFFIVGDQASSLPGWQEGAITAALNAISRLTNPKLRIPYLKALPDTRIMVEGV